MRTKSIHQHYLRMLFQRHKAIFNAHCVSFLLFLGLAVWIFIPKNEVIQVTMYQYARLLNIIGKEHVFNVPYSGGYSKQSVYSMTTHPYFPRVSKQCVHVFLRSVWISLSGSLTLAVLLSWYFVREDKLQSQNQFIRDSKPAQPNQVKHQMIENRTQSDMTIAKKPVIEYMD